MGAYRKKEKNKKTGKWEYVRPALWRYEFIKNGPNPEQLARVKEYMLKKNQENQKENGYWLNNLVEYYSNGIDNTKDYEAIVSGISVKDVQKFAKSLFKQGNKATIIMTVPEGN